MTAPHDAGTDPCGTLMVRRNEKAMRDRPLIKFQNVGLTLAGREILNNVTLTVGDGEFVCVVGHSGCGKTTLLRLIACLFKPTLGTVTFDGNVMTRPRQDIAVVFQDYGKALLPWRTAAGNVALAL
jgi:NitT/TauT family transport system ATP-binding protein